MIKLLEHLRYLVFWTLDFLKGSPIHKNYKEIKRILDNPNDSNVKNINAKNLNDLLQFSVKTTSFYKEYINYKDLMDFPVINKNTVLENFESFKSEKFKNSKLHEVYTSGSTGIRFTIFQNENKKNRNTADTIYFSNAAGMSIGDQLIYLRLWDHTNRKSKWQEFSQNILPHYIMDSSDEDIASLISKIEKSRSTKSILGYPSFFEQICKYLDKKNYTLKQPGIKTIISFAESLNDYEREKMSHYFNAPIFERYSNQENGILAQQTLDSKAKYKLNWASYFIEILEIDSNKHVKSGELGRIVVTDLFNYSMPLIRYDTGDMGIYEETNTSLPVLSKVYGRRLDLIYNTNGKIISSHIFYKVLEYSKAKQYQFKQIDKTKYTFVLNGKKEDTRENEIINYFTHNYLGKDAIITFEYVDEIPILSSGKRKETLNEWALKNR